MWVLSYRVRGLQAKTLRRLVFNPTEIGTHNGPARSHGLAGSGFIIEASFRLIHYLSK